MTGLDPSVLNLMNGDQIQSVSGCETLEGRIPLTELTWILLKNSKLHLKSRFMSNMAKAFSEWHVYKMDSEVLTEELK